MSGECGGEDNNDVAWHGHPARVRGAAHGRLWNCLFYASDTGRMPVPLGARSARREEYSDDKEPRDAGGLGDGGDKDAGGAVGEVGGEDELIGVVEEVFVEDVERLESSDVAAAYVEGLAGDEDFFDLAGRDIGGPDAPRAGGETTDEDECAGLVQIFFGGAVGEVDSRRFAG